MSDSRTVQAIAGLVAFAVACASTPTGTRSRPNPALVRPRFVRSRKVTIAHACPALGRCAWAILVLIVTVSCAPAGRILSPTSSADACLATLGLPEPVSGLFVEPDDGVDPVIDELTAAACTIDVAVYILSDDLVIETLGAAAARGVRVRVMLEEFPFGGGGGQVEVRERLERHGIEVRWSAANIRFSHAKYAVVDRQAALIMNQNLTTSAFTANREFGVITTDRASVDQAQEIFDRDWRHAPLDDPGGPLIASPTNSRERFLDLIADADQTIDFYAEVIRDPEIVTALGTAESRGVEVRLIVDASMDEGTQAIAAELFGAGAEIRLAESLYIHAKLLVIDDELAVVGSQNFTPTSLDDNRELAIVATDGPLLERCAATFERDWRRAVPGAPA